MKIDTAEGQKKDAVKAKKKGGASTKDKQDKDEVTIEQVGHLVSHFSHAATDKGVRLSSKGRHLSHGFASW